jgi:hypothetical protein
MTPEDRDAPMESGQPKQDVYVRRAAEYVTPSERHDFWLVTQWNEDKQEEVNIRAENEDAAKNTARQMAAISARRAWLVNDDGSETPID